MAQFLRPDGIITQGLWSGNISGLNFHLDIDEITRSDTDYALSQVNQNTLGEASLSHGFSPQQTSGRVFRYVLRRSASNKNLTISVSLMEGTTVVAGWEHVNPSVTFTLFERDVSGVSITDYTNLSARLNVTSQNGGGIHAQVSWVELEIPDAVATSDTPAYTKGQNTLASSVHAYLSGPQEFKSSIHAYMKGQASANASIPAYMTGPLLVKSSIHAYVTGWWQDLIPDSDTGKVGDWLNEVSGVVLYASLGEGDAEYVWAEYLIPGSYFEVALQDPGPIPEDAVAYYEWRAWRMTGAEAISMRVELRQGNEISIAVDDRVLGDSPQTYRRDLTQAEIDSITATTDLRLRFIVTGIS